MSKGRAQSHMLSKWPVSGSFWLSPLPNSYRGRCTRRLWEDPSPHLPWSWLHLEGHSTPGLGDSKALLAGEAPQGRVWSENIP